MGLVWAFGRVAIVKGVPVITIQVGSRVNRQVDGVVLDVALVLLGEELLGRLDAIALAGLALARRVATFADAKVVRLVAHYDNGLVSTKVTDLRRSLLRGLCRPCLRNHPNQSLILSCLQRIEPLGRFYCPTQWRVRALSRG